MLMFNVNPSEKLRGIINASLLYLILVETPPLNLFVRIKAKEVESK